MTWWGSRNTIKERRVRVIQRKLWVLFENLAKKIWNNSWSKSLRHSAWLNHSVFQLLKTQVMATSPMVKGNMGKFEVRIVCSNPKESFCLNACVLLRRESIVATPDPSLSLSLLRDECHTRFSKEQNQTNHMCAQEVHTYVRMKKYQKQCYYITYT
jgi:hypothetical protein